MWGKLTDLVVTLPKSRGGKVHLGEKGEAWKYNEAPSWETRIKPTKFKIGERVFILTEGYVQGFFLAEYSGWEGQLHEDEARETDAYWEIDFVNNSWRPIIPIRMESFRGIRYRKFNFINIYDLLNYHPEDLIHVEYWAEDFITLFEERHFFCADLGEIDRSKWF